MTAPTATQPLTPDELIEDLAANLPKLTANSERISPFTVIEYARSSGRTVGYTRASNALHALYSSGLLHETSRDAVYGTRPDLPTSGNGHVWLRIKNLASAPVEVTADQPRPEAGWSTVNLTWKCHGCTESDNDLGYTVAVQRAQEHADECHGQNLAP